MLKKPEEETPKTEDEDNNDIKPKTITRRRDQRPTTALEVEPTARPPGVPANVTLPPARKLSLPSKGSCK